MPPAFQCQRSTPWTSCNSNLWVASKHHAQRYSLKFRPNRRHNCLYDIVIPKLQSSGQLTRYSVVAQAQHDEADSYSESANSDPPSTPQQRSPSLMDGVNWYCYTALCLLFLTDFTPLGQWLISSAGPTAAGRLALLQWAVFVLPTLFWVHSKGWDFKQTFRLLPTSAGHCLTGLAAGPVLWLAVNTAIAIKTGNTDILAGAAAGAASSSAGISEVDSGALLLGAGLGDQQQVPVLLLSAAVSPAVAEELLFRGFLLTAMQERLGRIDAAAVCAALFALIHLEPSQFFLYCVLGGACGAVTLASGSVVPAMLLHFGFNAAAVSAGLALHR